MPRKKKDQQPEETDIDEYARRAEEIELEKERKRVERELRKKRRLAKKRSEKMEKLFAPIMFFVVWLVGWLIYIVFRG